MRTCNDITQMKCYSLATNVLFELSYYMRNNALHPYVKINAYISVFMSKHKITCSSMQTTGGFICIHVNSLRRSGGYIYIYIYVSKLTIISSDNGLSPDRLQAINWTNPWTGCLKVATLQTKIKKEKNFFFLVFGIDIILVYRLGQKFLDFFLQSPKRVCNLIWSSLIIHYDIQRSPKCFYFEYDWYTP